MARIGNKIKRSDLISDEMLKAPAELAKGLKDCRTQLSAIQKQLGWYPRIPAMTKKVESVSIIRWDFDFVPGVLIGLLLGSLLTLGIIYF